MPFGEGELPFAELFELLADSGYDGPVVVELEEVDWDEPLPAAIAAREYVESSPYLSLGVVFRRSCQVLSILPAISKRNSYFLG